MIRREKAEFLDNVLMLFQDKLKLSKRWLEKKYEGDYYTYHQTEKHLAILEQDGMVKRNELDEYHVQPKGRTVLGDIENLGYLAKHRQVEAEMDEQEEKEATGLSTANIMIFVIDVLMLIFIFLKLSDNL